MSINPAAGEAYALEGRVVTMDAHRSVHDRAVIYIQNGLIHFVLPTNEPPPPGFEQAPIIKTGGTIYPGLIELHNHLSYNILPLWRVPQTFANRSKWKNHKQKQQLVTAPMQVLGKTPTYVEAIVRYVECKCLVSGVTTSQGITLSGVGVQKFYQGLVRNVEAGGDPTLPAAGTRIDDVKDAEAFFKTLSRPSTRCLLLHLCEGVDEDTELLFQNLQRQDGSWAINDRLAGIHSAGLNPVQLQTMHEHGGSVIWSPLSNLLLYKGTARIRVARDLGMLIALGSDWSPSGSKNLLCEMKVAQLYRDGLDEDQGPVFTAQQIVEMVTCNPARILKWEASLGSIEAGKRADLLVIDNRQGDPYQHLINARESTISLVVIQGVPRFGWVSLMLNFGPGTEAIKVGGNPRLLNLDEPGGNPLVGGLSLQAATDRLRDGLRRLPELALRLENPNNGLALLANLHTVFETREEAQATLAAASANLGVSDLTAPELDTSERPLAFIELELDDSPAPPADAPPPPAHGGGWLGVPSPFESVLYSQVLQGVTIELDGLTLVDDDAFFTHLAAQRNLPVEILEGLPRFYGRQPALPPDAAPFEKVDAANRWLFASTQPLSQFLAAPGYLSRQDRLRIVEQALVLLERVYVHLPFKRAMYAIDPIQRLRLLQFRLEQQADNALSPEIDFHNELTRIFTSARDLHTNYMLPSPFREQVAFLPFLIEEYFDGDTPKYVVSKIVGHNSSRYFQEGVEVLYWNGTPIRRAIELNAEQQAGGNAAARHARGLDALCIRPLVRVLPPDEEWVTLRYRDSDGVERDNTQRWMVFSPPDASGPIDPDGRAGRLFGVSNGSIALGFDHQTDAIHQVRKLFFASAQMHAQAAMEAGKSGRPGPRLPSGDLGTMMPTVFAARPVSTPSGDFGYIRIFTFQVPDAAEFVQEFMFLAQQLPQNGLIIDVRGNGGGLIYAAECLLQVLTPHLVEPQRAEFINTSLVREICRRHSSKLQKTLPWQDFDLGDWQDSVEQSIQTGATYSLAFPITPRGLIHSFSQAYFGPVVLVTDGLCYSATDMFTAGFQDYRVGKILGVSSNTGAGGANVWTHGLLSLLMSEMMPPYQPLPGSPFKPLPYGANLRAAVRRILRSGNLAGTPLEDFGVQPDGIHRMTWNDLMHQNVDLVNAAGALLAKMEARSLKIEAAASGDAIRLSVHASGIDWLEILCNRRLVFTGSPAEDMLLEPTAGGWDHSQVEIKANGYAQNELVAVRKLIVEVERVG